MRAVVYLMTVFYFFLLYSQGRPHWLTQWRMKRLLLKLLSLFQFLHGKEVLWIYRFGFIYIMAFIWYLRYIKIQLKTIDLSTRLWGTNPTNSVSTIFIGKSSRTRPWGRGCVGRIGSKGSGSGTKVLAGMVSCQNSCFQFWVVTTIKEISSFERYL